MKIEVRTNDDGETVVMLSEVYSGVGIQTEAGLFGIAERDGGIEVMLDQKSVWALSDHNAHAPLVNMQGSLATEQATLKDFSEEADRIAAAVRNIKGKLGPLLRGEQHLAAAVALTGMAAHHVLHDGGGEQDFLEVCRVAWLTSVAVHSTECGPKT